MSNAKTEVLPTVSPRRPAPTRRSILHAASASIGQPAAVPAQPERSPFAGWRGRAQTEPLPVFPRVSTPAKPTRGRVARRTAPTGTKGLRRQSRLSRHLRAALAGLLIAAAILIPMQLFAAHGISSARQAALAARPDRASHTQPEQSSPEASPATTLSGQSTHAEQGAPSALSGQSPAQPEWVTEHTGAAYDRTNPAASPLTLPRCTTSPDTPLPCLATISPSQTRAVVLEEDTSLTALVRR
uniref:Uncharacterized protein n=1 Tax=Myoviridae sp. cte0t5 TaxID=2823549 RepID=A0A8S5LHB2_9CAUD|nr:MAG TPA: hypothetical protein [Myoviridae sp. cte0t5]